MFNEFRTLMFNNYHRARDHFISNPDELIEIERYITSIVNDCLDNNYEEFVRDYNEASYLYPFWANYPPDDRGRSPIGDQVPWIEVGEHAVGHKLSRLLSESYDIAEVGLPSGADNRFILWSKDILDMTEGFTDRAFIFLDIKSVGPRDNHGETVISPYQASGDGLWERRGGNLSNSIIEVSGAHVSDVFYPAISPVYVLSDGCAAPTVHLFIKPVYDMLPKPRRGQPLEIIKSICVPNGLLLTQNPNYLEQYPSLFFPGKDEKGKDPRKRRARVSFLLLEQIAQWRVQEIGGV